MQEPAYTPADIRAHADAEGWIRTAAEYPVLLANAELAGAWELAVRCCDQAEGELEDAQAELARRDSRVDELSGRLQDAINRERG